MRRSVHVQLVLLPMLATATVATAQPGPQDPQPPPPPDPAQQVDPSQLDPAQQMPDMGTMGDGNGAPGSTDPTLSPPGMTPTIEEGGGQQGAASLCNRPETWPLYNQELGVPPYECTQVVNVCDDPIYWNSLQCGGGMHFGGGGFHVIRGGFGHYFGTGGG